MYRTFNDERKIRRIRMAMAVGRARAKLTVLEYNALALRIKAEVLADLEAANRT
jgi:hypothetical protein